MLPMFSAMWYLMKCVQWVCMDFINRLQRKWRIILIFKICDAYLVRKETSKICYTGGIWHTIFVLQINKSPTIIKLKSSQCTHCEFRFYKSLVGFYMIIIMKIFRDTYDCVCIKTSEQRILETIILYSISCVIFSCKTPSV